MNGIANNRKMAVDENMRGAFPITQNNLIGDIKMNRRSNKTDPSLPTVHLSNIQNTSKNGRSGKKAGLKRSATSLITRKYQV